MGGGAPAEGGGAPSAGSPSSPRTVAEGVSRALLTAAEERFAALGGRVGDAMVLHGNGTAHRAREAAGYAPQPRRSRWVRTLTG